MRLNADGLDALIRTFEKLEGNTSEIAHRGLYKAAGVVADEIKAGLNALPIQEDPDGTPPTIKDGQKLSGVTSKEKQSLISSMGIAPHRESGGKVSTSVGFSGNSSVRTQRFPGGVPNAALMRGIESGTSMRQKHPVIRPALNRVKERAAEAAKQEIIDQLQKEI